MSNNIFDEKNNIIDSRSQTKRHLDLKSYVKRILKQKRMTLRDVQLRSGGAITQAYVGAIVQGIHSNPTVEKLKALARGLGVDEDELFRAARGIPKQEASGTQSAGSGQTLDFLELMQRIAADPGLLSIVEELVTLPPDAQTAVLKMVRTLSEPGQSKKPKSKIG